MKIISSQSPTRVTIRIIIYSSSTKENWVSKFHVSRPTRMWPFLSSTSTNSTWKTSVSTYSENKQYNFKYPLKLIGMLYNVTRQQDVLLLPNTKWSFEPERGMTLKSVMINNTGNNRCVGTMGNVTTEKYFTISVKGKIFNKWSINLAG